MDKSPVKKIGAMSNKKIDKNVVKRLWSYLKHYKWLLVVVAVCLVVGAVANVAGSLFLQVLIDNYITPLISQSSPVLTGLFQAILIMAGIYLLGALSTLIYTRLMVIVSQNTLLRIRLDVFSHMQTLPIKYFDTHTHGDVMSHYTNDVDTLEEMISHSLPQMFSSLVMVVAVTCAMLFTSVWLTLFVFVFVVAMLRVTQSIAKKSSSYFVKQQKSIAQVNGFVEEMVNGQKVVKVFCHEEESQKDFDEKNDELCENATQANKLANILMPIMANLGNLQFIAIAILGGIMAVSGFGNLTLGMVVAFLQLSKSFSQPINQAAQQINSLAMAMAGVGRIFKLLDEKSEIDDGIVTLVNAKNVNNNLVETSEKTELWAWKYPNDDGSVKYIEVKGDIRFHNVDFGYENDKVILHHIDLYAKPAQKIAFVGATGAGKTTITNLINRFYDIADGKIEYDGIEINKIKKADLRHSLGMVTQNVNLFSGTVLENIRYGNLDATEKEAQQAAKLANADDFIKRLPQGYQTLLTGAGDNLSQGQRQLLSIARVAVADPPVMILDEATSSIDTRTEAIVQKGMDSLMKGRTVFVIAHRLSTIQNSNAIMVLDQGEIIERGDHDELVSRQGEYYKLYTGSFELE